LAAGGGMEPFLCLPGKYWESIGFVALGEGADANKLLMFR
jgi:hypothetical protein